MNRYAITGATDDARHGKRVLVITWQVKEWLRECAAKPDVDKGFRANGSGQVDYIGGGWVRVVGAGRSLRGMSADVVYLEGDSAMQRWIIEDAQIVCEGSRYGEVIRS